MTQTECCPILAFWVMVGSSARKRFSSSCQRARLHYGRRSGQPSSSSLARRACVHYSPWLTFYCSAPLVFVLFKFVYWLFLKFASAPGPFGGRGEMALAVASSARHAFFRGAVCASTPYNRHFPFRSLYSGGPLSSRPQPLGRGGDVAPCEDTREDFGLSI